VFFVVIVIIFIVYIVLSVHTALYIFLYKDTC